MKIARQCRGTVKATGLQCRLPALMGQRVCYRHGGNTQHAIRAARMRMLAACEPAIMVLLKVVGDERAAYADRINAAKLILDRGGMAPGINIEAVIEHKVPGWENVLKGMFAAPAAIEAAEPSLQDLKDAYARRGLTDPERCRSHACQILGRDVESAHDLSSAEISELLRALAPSYGDDEIIDAEIVDERRYEPPAARVPDNLVNADEGSLPGPRGYGVRLRHQGGFRR